MKFFTILALSLAATSAFAKAQEGYGVGGPLAINAKLIYDALNVQPIPSSAFEAWYNDKAVGGLYCRETRTPYPTAPATYACDLRADYEDDGAIYEALNVKPVAINPGIAGSGAYEKTVGSLTCTRRQIVYPHAPIYYSCTLK